MNLKELLSQNPEAKSEYENNIQESESKGEKNVQDIIDAVMPFLNNENYKGLEALAAEVLSGKTDISALKSAVSVLDVIAEKGKSKAAIEDTNDNPDTPHLSGELPNENGIIEEKMVTWVKKHGSRKTEKFAEIEIFEKLPSIWKED